MMLKVRCYIMLSNSQTNSSTTNQFHISTFCFSTTSLEHTSSAFNVSKTSLTLAWLQMVNNKQMKFQHMEFTFSK